MNILAQLSKIRNKANRDRELAEHREAQLRSQIEDANRARQKAADKVSSFSIKLDQSYRTTNFQAAAEEARAAQLSSQLQRQISEGREKDLEHQREKARILVFSDLVDKLTTLTSLGSKRKGSHYFFPEGKQTGIQQPT